MLDPAGNPTPRLEIVEQADVARLTQEDWQRERDRMIRLWFPASCAQRCHA